MRIFHALLPIILMLVTESFCIDLKCSVVLDYWICDVYDLIITSSDDAITSVNGDTEPTQYTVLQIQNQKVKFVPKNIGKFFPELEQLEISNSSLKWIEREDLRELEHLKNLNLNENQLEILENNLFDFNKELQTINIRHNKLEYVSQYIFQKLAHLHSIDLEGNICTIAIYYNNAGYYFKNAYKDSVSQQLSDKCHSGEAVSRVYKNKFLEQINALQSDIKKLTHQLKTCDGNFDAALTNLHLQQLVNSNTELAINKQNESPMVKVKCEYDDHEEEVCNAIEFKVSFANSSIESEFFEGEAIKTLKIHQQQTLFLPSNLADTFPILSDLLVTESGLYEIDYNVLKGLFQLVNLQLTNNKLQEIPVDTFRDLENLQELDLSFNKIQNLYDDVFLSLKSLQKLRLNNNYLTSIKIEVVKNLDNLNGLFLQNNQLKFISATLLTPMSSLNSVDLSDNMCINMSYPTSSWIDIEAAIINNCIAPVELYCEFIQLETKEILDNGYTCQVKDLFIKYPKTKISKVIGNKSNDSVKIFFADKQSIKSFPFQLSQNFPNLERIEIQQSKLISLHQMDFDGLGKLKQIVIQQNNLSFIGEGSFDSVPQLELLDLSSNNIVSLPAKIFMKLTRLGTLVLSNNQIAKFTADFLPRKNMIEVFRADNNQLEIIETKTLRFLRKAKLIDLSRNICIDMKFDKSENSTRALVELSGEIDLNCSSDD